MRQGLNFFLKRIFPNGTTSVPFSSGRQVLGWTPSTATILNQQHQHNLGMCMPLLLINLGWVLPVRAELTNPTTLAIQKHWNRRAIKRKSRWRLLRSAVQWFTEFCNSHCVSQFAASFIVVRAKTSIAESLWNCTFVWNQTGIVELLPNLTFLESEI